MAPPGEPPPLDIARGNKALASYLTEALKLLRDRSDNSDFRHLVDDVLAGRASLRDAYTTPAFAAGIDNGVREFGTRWDELSREERNRLAQQGQQAINTENERLDAGS